MFKIDLNSIYCGKCPPHIDEKPEKNIQIAKELCLNMIAPFLLMCVIRCLYVFFVCSTFLEWIGFVV